MDRKWMLDVMETPASQKEEAVPSGPVTIQITQITKQNDGTEGTVKQVQSSIVPPNNAIQESAPSQQITTLDYIKNILTENLNWQNRNPVNIRLPKTGVAVNAVSPIQSSVNTNGKENGAASSRSRAPTSTQSRPPPDDLETENDEMIASLEQSRLDDEKELQQRLEGYRNLANEENDTTNNNFNAGDDFEENEEIIIDDDDDQDEVIDEEEEEEQQEEDEEEEEENLQSPSDSVNTEMDDSELPDIPPDMQTTNNSNTNEDSDFSTIFPLNPDFLDTLGRLWEEKSPALNKLADVRLFEGSGHPVDNIDLTVNSSANNEERMKEEESKDPRIFFDLDAERRKIIEEEQRKILDQLETSKRQNEDKSHKKGPIPKKVRTKASERTRRDETLRQILNMPAQSSQNPQDTPQESSASSPPISGEMLEKITDEYEFLLPMPSKDWLQHQKKQGKGALPGNVCVSVFLLSLTSRSKKY